MIKSQSTHPAACPKCKERDEALQEALVALEACKANDKTIYKHHQKRRDGKKPSENGGTRWSTPYEIATVWLQKYKEVL